MASHRKPELQDVLFRAAKGRKVPFDFVLDELAPIGPTTRPMFGSTAVYDGEKIVFVLREKNDRDDGVWLATDFPHHAALRALMPSLHSISIFGFSKWQLLPSDADGFEESVLLACKLVCERDPRIGKIPARKAHRARTKGKATAQARTKKPSPRP